MLVRLRRDAARSPQSWLPACCERTTTGRTDLANSVPVFFFSFTAALKVRAVKGFSDTHLSSEEISCYSPKFTGGVRGAGLR